MMWGPRFAALRAVIFALLFAFAVFNECADVALSWHPFGEFGFAVDAGMTVISVTPGSDAQHAGVRVGDRFDAAATPLSSRRYLLTAINAAPPGTRAAFVVRSRGGTHTIDLRAAAHPRTFADNATNLLLVVATFASMTIGLWLAIVRPSLMTMALFFCTFGGVGFSTTVSMLLPDRLFWANLLVFTLVTTGATLPLFALRFPHHPAVGRRAFYQRLFLIAWPAVAILNTVYFYEIMQGFARADLSLAYDIVASATLIVSGFIFCANYAAAKPNERAKIRWIGVGFTIGYVLPFLFQVTTSIPGFSVSLSIPEINLLQAGVVAMPLSAAYVIVRHHVFDIRFVLGRAAVYGALTSIVVAGVTLLDYLAGKLIAESRFAFLGDATIAIIVGLSLSVVHRRIEAFVERIFFRGRRRAEDRLRRVGEGLVDAASSQAISAGIVDEAVPALGLVSLAIFRRRGERFACDAAAGWSDPAPGCLMLDRDASAVLALGARREPMPIVQAVWPASFFPPAERAPLIAFPIVMFGRLEAIAFAGAHAGGEKLDPEETAILSALCRDAGAAYEHLDAKNAIDEVARLTAEVTTLHALLRPATAQIERGSAPLPGV
jgi:hypothetical protein